MTRVEMQPAFILHRRPFRDTSLLIDCLTVDYGRVRLVARNARGLRSRFKGLLEPFVPFLLSWSGKTELATLTKAESQGMPYWLQGLHLVNGFYLNELLLRLLPADDAHPTLYWAYQATVEALTNGQCSERILRLFEKLLLIELGYGISLQHDQNGDAIKADKYYRFSPEVGFALSLFAEKQSVLFLGEHLLALHQGTLQTKEQLQAAKRLLRLLLRPLLGDKPIKSRELYLCN